MEKNNHIQPDLFSESGIPGLRNKNNYNNLFLKNIWKFEKTILIILGIIGWGIISFSLGVEKGKKLSIKNREMPVTAPAATNTQQKQKNEISYSLVKNDGVKEQDAKPENTKSAGEYIIQLASYKIDSYAKKEAELLKKKGLEPLILKKGNYTVLCVGNFTNKETAQAMLPELKKRYTGCYIRRL